MANLTWAKRFARAEKNGFFQVADAGAADFWPSCAVGEGVKKINKKDYKLLETGPEEFWYQDPMANDYHFRKGLDKINSLGLEFPDIVENALEGTEYHTPAQKKKLVKQAQKVYNKIQVLLEKFYKEPVCNKS